MYFRGGTAWAVLLYRSQLIRGALWTQIPAIFPASKETLGIDRQINPLLEKELSVNLGEKLLDRARSVRQVGEVLESL